MATPKQIKAVEKISENLRSDQPQPIGEVLREVGYSTEVSKKPALVTQSKGFVELMDQYLDDEELTKIHRELLHSTKVEHMVFPIEHYEDEDDIPLEGDIPPEVEAKMNKPKRVIDNLTDQDIIDMLAEVNCKVKKIVHGETARHVYYWVADSKARTDALKLAYGIKGKIKGNGDAPPAGNIYNTFIQQNNMNPNDPDNKVKIDRITEMLMEETKQ